MIVLDVLCRARVHDTEEARSQAGCCCPVAWGTPPFRPVPARRPWQRPYISGRIENRKGRRRSTVPESDWVAVERALVGDRSLTLAVVERDEAIDRLDRRGLNAAEVARCLGITMRTVQRRRSLRRAPGERVS